MSDIEKYKTQLQQVESILSNDPNNAQFLKIQADLKKLIELTTGSTPNNGSDISGTNDDENDDLDRLYDKENPTLIEDVTPSDTGSFENTSEMKHDFKIGDNIGITSSGSNGRPYSGIITAISPESNTCSVQYYEFIDKSGEVILPVSQLYHLSTLINIERAVMSPQDIEVGGVYQCKYSADQQYYNATVDEVYHHKGLPQTTDNTAYVVTYTEYLNKEVVPIEYIRRVPEDAGSVSASSGSNSTSIVNSAAHLLPQDEELLKIPESMKILPTDSEEVWCKSELCICSNSLIQCVYVFYLCLLHLLHYISEYL